MKTPETIVQEQLDFYNIHDLENFLSMYHNDIKIFNLLDNSIILSGKEQLREKCIERFHVLKVHARLKNRIVMGNKIIDHSEVAGLVKDKAIEMASVYEIQDGLIKNLWFIYN